MQRLAVLTTGNFIRLADLPDKVKSTHGELDELLARESESGRCRPLVGVRRENGPHRSGRGEKNGDDPDKTWLPLSD